jgi:sporulation protein YlmC with PRC-barrel domain
MKLLTAAALSLCLSATAFAQQGPGTDSSANPKSNSQPQAAAGNSASNFVTNEGQGEWLVGNVWNKSVYNAAGKSIGDLKDVLIDKDGKVVAIVVGVGGFLGLGEKDVAVDYNYLKNNGGISDKRITIGMTEQQLREAPTFRRSASSNENTSR